MYNSLKDGEEVGEDVCSKRRWARFLETVHSSVVVQDI